MPPTKAELKQALVAALEATLQVLKDAHAAERSGTTHDEAKPENDKDTRTRGRRTRRGGRRYTLKSSEGPSPRRG